MVMYCLYNLSFLCSNFASSLSYHLQLFGLFLEHFKVKQFLTLSFIKLLNWQ